MHLRVERFTELSRHLRRHGDSQIARSGCDSIWQNQPGRVRHWLVNRKFRDETDPEAALIMSAIAGHDPQDSTALNEPVPDYTARLGHDLRGVRLGLPKEYLIEGIDPQVKAAIDAAVKQMNSLGAEIVEVSLPTTEYAIAVYYILATAEASANLARFDGVRYGYRTENPRDMLDLYGHTRKQGFGSEVKRRIIIGTYFLSSAY